MGPASPLEYGSNTPSRHQVSTRYGSTCRGQESTVPNIFSITKYFYLQEEQQAVQVVEGLADGRAGDAPLVDGGEPERHLRHLGPGGLDHLRLVQTDPPPLHSAKCGKFSRFFFKTSQTLSAFFD